MASKNTATLPSDHDPLHVKTLYNTFVRPTFVDSLARLGLDVIYHRAAGNYLYSKDDNGHERPVLDLVGGAGATLLGHNHPELVQEAQSLLAAGVPFHGQRSVRANASMLAEKLNEILLRETQQPYVITYANSGAEANELAIKHALFERQELLDSIYDPAGSIKLSAEENKHNHSVLATPPTFVSIQHGFHGKTNASLAVSYSNAIKPNLIDGVLPCEYVVANNELETASVLQQYETYLYTGPGTTVRFTPVVAVLAEPILGDGGVIELDGSYLRLLSEWCDRLRTPLILDEIQCGSGRTGYLLASTASGTVADYCTLSKSLSGGLGKTSVLAVRSDRFVRRFGLVNSSTYNEDDWSSAIALRFLEICERDDVFRSAASNGLRIKRRLEELKESYPSYIAGIRGRGMMLALEWKAQAGSALPEETHLAQHIEGYMLTRHNIRIGTTIPTPYVNRLTPSALIDDCDIEHFVNACAQYCDESGI